MQYLGNSIYLKCFLLLLLSRLIPSVKVLIAAWAMCMISLQQGCIRKSDTDSSNNGTFLLLSVTWLQQELCKFPAIRFWQVAGNQSNTLYISHIHSIAWKTTTKKKKHKKPTMFNILTWTSLEHRLKYGQCLVMNRFMWCWGVCVSSCKP